jgi:hypothetical protein
MKVENHQKKLKANQEIDSVLISIRMRKSTDFQKNLSQNVSLVNRSFIVEFL